MIVASGASFRHILILLILILALTLPKKAWGSNRAIGLKILEQDNVTKFALLLTKQPQYRLRSAKGNQLLLTLYDAVKTSNLDKALSGGGQKLSLKTSEKPASLEFRIKLKKPLREVATSWLSKERLLILIVHLAKGGDSIKADNKKPARLKSIRFGTSENHTRMVMRISRLPSWEILYRGNENLKLKVEATSKSLRQIKYGPMKRLKSAVVSKAKGQAGVDIALDSRIDHLRVFWLKQGNRMVADFLDRPDTIISQGLRIDPQKDGGKGAETGASGQNQKKTSYSSPGEELEDSFMRMARKQDVTPGVPGLIKAQGGVTNAQAGSVIAASEKEGKDPESEETNFVRKPIPQSWKIGPRPIRRDKRSKEQFQHFAQTRTEKEPEKIPLVRPEEEQVLYDLSSEEAFMFGRIQEAWEIHDYEKGATLVDDFLVKFPDSPLLERLYFLRADFRLSLLKSGRRGILREVLKNYQDAVTKFKNSEEVQGTYVKMAQANTYLGKDYEALGFLNMVLNKYKKGKYLPLGHLVRARIYLRVGKTEKAIKDLKTILDRYLDSNIIDEARYGIASYYHSVGRFKEAETRLEEISRSNREYYLENPEYLLLRARNFFYLEDYGSARVLYFKALNLGNQIESNDLLISRIGDTYHQEAMEREAQEFYKLAIDSYPESEGATIAKLRLANYSSGVSAYEEVHKKNATKAIGDLALLQMAKKYYENKQYVMAMETLKKLMAKSIHPDIKNEAKFFVLKVAEKELKRLYDEVEYQKVIDYYDSEDPGVRGDVDPEARLLVGISYHRLGQFKEAIPIFSDVKLYDLGLVWKGRYLISLADSYLKTDEEGKAQELLEKNLQKRMLSSDQQKLTVMLADIYKGKGALKKAYGLYRPVVRGKRLLPDAEIADVYLSMGEITNARSRYERAREFLNRSIALAEKDEKSRGVLQSAYVEMGNSYYLQGKYRKAIKSYGEGLEKGFGQKKKNYWETQYRLALCYIETKETAEAERIMNDISEQGSPILQQKAQLKLGTMGLEKQLKRLPIWKEAGSASADFGASSQM